MLKVFLLISFLALGAKAQTQNQALDKASQEAMEKTQQLLNSPEQRNAFIQKDAGAKAADDKLKSIPGLTEADQQKAYEISGQIMNALVQKTGGDVTKQKEIMDQASRDPQSFFNNLPADQRQQIDDLAAKAEARTAPAQH